MTGLSGMTVDVAVGHLISIILAAVNSGNPLHWVYGLLLAASYALLFGLGLFQIGIAAGGLYALAASFPRRLRTAVINPDAIFRAVVMGVLLPMASLVTVIMVVLAVLWAVSWFNASPAAGHPGTFFALDNPAFLVVMFTGWIGVALLVELLQTTTNIFASVRRGDRP